MVAGADLWVYNAENLCVSIFNQVASIFHLRGGKIKKQVSLGLLVHTLKTDPSAPRVPLIYAETFCVVRQADFGYKSSLCLFITFPLYFSLF